jgi:hypothetical protein
MRRLKNSLLFVGRKVMGIDMEEILEKLKSGADKLKKGAKKVTKQVVRKTNDAVSQTKINFAINETESKVTEIYENMGRNIYREYLKSGEAEESMIESCIQIDKLFEEIDDLKEKIAELKQSVKCTECGEYNKNGAAYCSTCGAQLNTEQDSDDKPEEETEEVEAAAEKTTNKKVVTIHARRPVSQED